MLCVFFVQRACRQHFVWVLKQDFKNMINDFLFLVVSLLSPFIQEKVCVTLYSVGVCCNLVYHTLWLNAKCWRTIALLHSKLGRPAAVPQKGLGPVMSSPSIRLHSARPSNITFKALTSMTTLRLLSCVLSSSFFLSPVVAFPYMNWFYNVVNIDVMVKKRFSTSSP